MQYQPFSTAKAYRRFIALSNQLKRLLDSGAYYLLPPEKRARLLHDLRALYRQLSSVLSPRRLRRILASGAAVLALGLPAAQAQLFSGPQKNPFGINFGEDLLLPQFVDIDGDGDLDILARGYGYYDGFTLVFLENIGTADAPAFGPPQINNFLPEGLAGYPTTLAFADIDGDGDFDMFVGTFSEYYNPAPVLFYENIGTPSNPIFAPPQVSPFGLQPGTGFSAPAFVDIDGDGDLDFFAAVALPGEEYQTHLIYQENIGTSNAPAFGPVQNDPFGLPPALAPEIALPAFGDIDGDGDYDLIAGGEDYLYIGNEYRTYVQYFENVGTPTAPVFAPPIAEPLGIEFPINAYFSIPALADIDGDGDLDFFAFGYLYDPNTGEDLSVTWYFENTRINTSSRAIPVRPDYLELFPTATGGLVNWRLDAEAPLDRALHLDAYTPGGQRLERRLLFGAEGSFDISNWPAGYYVFRLSGPDGRPLGQQAIFKR